MANKFSLFGFTIARDKEEINSTVEQSFTPPSNDDGALTITSAAYYGTYVDLDGTAKNDVELISRYREMAMQPEIESAIDDIINEAICQDDDGKNIKIVLDDLNQPEKIKKAIRDEFAALSGGNAHASFAVRSSATAEDLPDASFAGQQVMRWAARRGLTRPSRRSGPRVLYFLDTFARRHDLLLVKAAGAQSMF